jgi:hypothetical protein
LTIAGYGFSAFLFSSVTQTFFPGDISALLAVLAVGTSIPMAIGALLVKPINTPDNCLSDRHSEQAKQDPHIIDDFDATEDALLLSLDEADVENAPARASDRPAVFAEPDHSRCLFERSSQTERRYCEVDYRPERPNEYETEHVETDSQSDDTELK